MENDSKPSVIVAYGDAMVLRALRRTLEDAGMRVLSTVDSGREAFEAVVRNLPDVLLIDRELADESGIEVTQRLRRMGQRLHIVVLSKRGDVDTALEALMAGANGYLTKDLGFDRLQRSLAATLAGEAVISRKLVGQVIDWLREESWASKQAEAMESSFAQLTPREWEVLDQLRGRRTTTEIAEALGISPETVRTHVKHVLHKTGSSDRRDAVARARQLNGEAAKSRTGAADPPGRSDFESRIE